MKKELLSTFVIEDYGAGDPRIVASLPGEDLKKVQDEAKKYLDEKNKLSRENHKVRYTDGLGLMTDAAQLDD